MRGRTDEVVSKTDGGIKVRNKYTIEEFEHIKNLVICALAARTKAHAKRYTDQLDYISFNVMGYARTVFSQLIAATKTAAGAVKDKERLVTIAHDYLLKLEVHCVE